MKKIRMIGNAHLDPVWLWQWQEGYQEIKATFRSALDRMNENKDFVFTCACAGYYAWAEENDPEMFEEIRARVREGRWNLVGGMWVQPDMNSPSGESIARHLLYSQRYFQEKFGVRVKVGYNVDTFGHNAMLPQLLRRAGIDSYVWMRPSIGENDRIPSGALVWEAPDGSRVTTYRIPNGYNSWGKIAPKIREDWKFSDQIGLPAMCFYGVGNHGGGPTKKNLAEIDAFILNEPEGSEVAYSSADDYFDELRRMDAVLPVWKGELQHHASGCYSTHNRTKRLHRQTENALLRMETLALLSRGLTGHETKKEFVRQAWRNVMFNEFHDVMGGCSIPEAMDDAETQYREALSIAAREENAALQKISWRVDTVRDNTDKLRSKEHHWQLWGAPEYGTPIVVFNPHPFKAVGTVLLRTAFASVRDDEGRAIPAQATRATRTNGPDKWDGIFRAEVPALGYRLFWVFTGEKKETANPISVRKDVMENERLCAQFDPETGSLIHLISKATGRDALSGSVCAKVIDIEHCDTWAHNIFAFDREVGAFRTTDVKLLENGPVRSVLRVRMEVEDSKLEIKYILYADADQLEMEIRTDLRLKHKMVKLCFPTVYGTDVSEIPYGVLTRSANGDEQPCQRWTAMQGEAGGLAVMNDGRYSYSAKNGELRVTIANTSVSTDHYGQNERDDECRYMDQGEMNLRLALYPYSGTWQEQNIHRRASMLNRGFAHVVETYHEGPLGDEYCGFEADNDRVNFTAFKRSEADDGVILRAAETTGKPQKVRVRLNLTNRETELSFGSFEVKTVFFPDDINELAREVLITETEAQ